MTAHLAPTFNAGTQFFTNQGVVLAGGLVYVYVAGSTTPTNSWTTSAQSVANANPIVLDSAGRMTGPVWIDDTITYKFVLKTSAGVTVATLDYVTGINGTNQTMSQWVDGGATPTYISTTSFSVPGDLTATFQVGRRVQATVTAGTVYSTIASRSYGAGITTVTVVNDSTVLDSGLSDVNVGIVTPIGSSISTASIGDFASVIATDAQTQLYQAFLTGGSATAYTLTPSPVIAALAANQRFRVKFHVANTGATPTLAVNGLTAKNLKVYGTTGVKENPAIGAFAINLLTDVEYDGTDYVVLDQIPRAATSAVTGTRVTNTAASAALAEFTPVTLAWDTETWDDGNWHDNVTNNSRITVTATGRYRLTVGLNFNVDTGGTYSNALRGSVKVLKNGSLLQTYAGPALSIYSVAFFNGSNVGQLFVNFTDQLLLTAADYLQIQAEAGDHAATITVLSAGSFFALELIV